MQYYEAQFLLYRLVCTTDTQQQITRQIIYTDALIAICGVIISYTTRRDKMMLLLMITEIKTCNLLYVVPIIPVLVIFAIFLYDRLMTFSVTLSICSTTITQIPD